MRLRAKSKPKEVLEETGTIILRCNKEVCFIFLISDISPKHNFVTSAGAGPASPRGRFTESCAASLRRDILKETPTLQARQAVLARDPCSQNNERKKSPQFAGLNPNLEGVGGDRCYFIAAQQISELYYSYTCHSRNIYLDRRQCPRWRTDKKTGGTALASGIRATHHVLSLPG